jgi:hypothetical protein
MRTLNQFSTNPRLTQPAKRLIGSLGIVNCSVGSIVDAGLRQPGSSRLTPRLERLVAHYLTEPQKVNFVTVTSFLNGLLYGLDVDPARDGFIPLFSISRVGDHPVIAPFDAGEVKVFDARVLAAKGRELLKAYPIEEGEGPFYEASSETPENAGLKPGRIYAALAIARPADKDQCYLLMEDAGRVPKNGRDESILKSLALSVPACEKRENLDVKRKTLYEEVYLQPPLVRGAHVTRHLGATVSNRGGPTVAATWRRGS